MVKYMGIDGLANSAGLPCNAKIGDVVINGAGRHIKVRKECLKCETLTGNKAHGKCKCCVKSSCPGWKKYTISHESIRKRSYSIRRALK